VTGGVGRLHPRLRGTPDETAATRNGRRLARLELGGSDRWIRRSHAGRHRYRMFALRSLSAGDSRHHIASLVARCRRCGRRSRLKMSFVHRAASFAVNTIMRMCHDRTGLRHRHCRQMPRAYDVEGAYDRWLQTILNYTLANQSTRHRASTSMYSQTFCVRVMLPERHQWKSAVQAAAVLLRTPPRRRPVTGQPATPTSHTRRAILRTPPVTRQSPARSARTPRTHTDRHTDARDHNTFCVVYDSRKM